MAYSINPKNSEDYLKRRMFLLLSRCFNRKNGKNYTFSEATEMLDKKKYSNLSKDNLSDKEIIETMVSKLFKMFIE